MKLFSPKRKTLSALLGFALIAVLLAACGNSATPPASTGNSSNGNGSTGSANANGKGCTKVGVLLPETASSPRWETYDKPALQKDIQAINSNLTVDLYNAQGDPNTQRNQADQALTKGDCILVVAPKDADAAAAIVTKAKGMGIPVVSYDRLINSKDLNYYVSYDGVAVGKLQGQYVIDHYKDYTKNGKNVVMINGSSDDNNAHLFYQGASETLKPLFDNGTLKKVYDQYTPGWDPATARNEMDQAMTANQNNIQIAYVANDTMANSVISALRAKQLNGKVLVTGQDATVTGIQNILLGDQAMTVFKSYSNEAQATADLVKALINGSDTSGIIKGQTTKTPGGADIPSVILQPAAVDKANLKQQIIDSGYMTKDQVCSGLKNPVVTGIC
ncbi:sugar ABC transporter substrate-binding protein [Ktedonosporobacter rubrisoli]|uniref:Sugar ABC transporter substrate-binding protein n=1 Tax=Ktedonosporobacter rubrisoli TaxID=2509675 RepID=A0A4P6K3Z1_KTERU|nr:sugar ABC transporter substrate-binding protein [Ktedonosporobacter rubrisoli]QBD82643.1 sugar ABC transporter substrate-binding protein [Ktedonosporobacter rubrisoli]